MTTGELIEMINEKGSDLREPVVVNVLTYDENGREVTKSYPVDNIEIGHREAWIDLDLR